MRIKDFAKALAPYVAVLIGLYVLDNAWLSILLYHAQIIAWRPKAWRDLITGWNWRKGLAGVTVCALAGLLIYFLFPLILKTPDALDTWLLDNGLTQMKFLAIAFYFGLIHPPLEQLHWSGIRSKANLGGWGHALFTGYHVLVIGAFLKLPWVAACAVILFAASLSWEWLSRKYNGLIVPVTTHIIADLGIVMAAYLFVYL